MKKIKKEKNKKKKQGFRLIRGNKRYDVQAESLEEASSLFIKLIK